MHKYAFMHFVGIIQIIWVLIPWKSINSPHRVSDNSFPSYFLSFFFNLSISNNSSKVTPAGMSFIVFLL